jgi:hypothetical protein
VSLEKVNNGTLKVMTKTEKEKPSGHSESKQAEDNSTKEPKPISVADNEEDDLPF